MTNDWWLQLEQAATELDEQSIQEVLEQISDEQALLAKVLPQTVDEVDLDKILNSIHQVSKI